MAIMFIYRVMSVNRQLDKWQGILMGTVSNRRADSLKKRTFLTCAWHCR